MADPVTANVTIANKLGLHARPATLFAETAGRFRSKITIAPVGNDQVVDGKSIMQMLMLAATKGTTLSITAEGPDAEDAVATLVTLVESRFEED